MSTGSAAPQFPWAVLCIGSDRWLRARAVERLRASFISPGFEETDFIRFSEPPPEPRPILESLQTAPFGSACRVVVVDGLEEISAESVPWLMDHLGRAEATGCAVLCADKMISGFPAAAAKGSRTTALGPAAAAGRVERILCHPLKGRELEEWIEARVREAGKAIEPAALRRLIGRVGENLQALDRAVENLTLLAGATEKITEQEVLRLIPPSVRESAFDILDSAAAGRPAAAIRSLRRAVAQGELTMDQFFGAIGWYYRNAWKNHRLPKREVAEALDDLLGSDVRFKQGHPDPELLASRLLLKLSGQPGFSS